MSTRAEANQIRKDSPIRSLAALSSLVQRKCACGGPAGLTGQCEDCDNEQLQRSVKNPTRQSRTESSRGALISRNHLCERLQTKLAISQPGDRLEREADTVAEQVMRSAEEPLLDEPTHLSHLPPISRLAASSEIARQPAEEEEEEAPSGETENREEEEEYTTARLSLKAASDSHHSSSPDVDTRIQSMRGGGKPLNAELRDFFEPRFGHDFSRVRVHTDARAAETARSLNARAYTLGHDVAFALGEYKPDTSDGRRLLAHELTHVVQQSDRVQTVMRTCDCSAMGAGNASSSLDASLRGDFPRLRTSLYCLTGPPTPTYNCFAWTIGNTSTFLDTEVDTDYGNNNGTIELSDFDRMYATRGLRPVTGSTPSNAQVALYADGTTPKHAARRRRDTGCGNFESKLGQDWRISHYPQDLEGGIYGNINRYYVPARRRRRRKRP